MARQQLLAGADDGVAHGRADLLQVDVGPRREELLAVAPNAVYVIVTNPCDVLTVIAQEETGLPPERIFASGTVLDTATTACARNAPIAGYYPGSDVVQHNRIDLDQAAMETALSAGDWTAATSAYAEGGNSLSKGSYRTIQGFSTGAQAKMYDGCPGCPYKHYSMFYDYYGDFDYADKWVSAALAGESMSFTSGKHGPNDFSALGDAARIEAVKKGAAYMNVWMYAVREFEDAIDDCLTCTSECNEFSVNSGSVHAWDEGVAFYTGTLEGTAEGGVRVWASYLEVYDEKLTDLLDARSSVQVKDKPVVVLQLMEVAVVTKEHFIQLHILL